MKPFPPRGASALPHRESSPGNLQQGEASAAGLLTRSYAKGETYTALVRPDGTGFSSYDPGDAPWTLTSWTPAERPERQGLLFFIRDLDDRRFWTLGGDPYARTATAFADRIVIEDRQEDLSSTLEISLLPDHPVEMRRLTLENTSSRTRRLDVTSLAEIVHNHPAAHQAHPVFSRLFLQTEFDPGHNALLVRRRPRGHHESHPALVHSLAGPRRKDLEFETDRALFFGRGRHWSRPAALAAAVHLGGTVGNVLDPVVSLRVPAELEPGRDLTLVFLLGIMEDIRDLPRVAAGPAKPLPGCTGQVRAAGNTGDLESGWGRERAVVRSMAMEESPDESPEPLDSEDPPELEFFNGYGGFSDRGREYVIKVRESRPGILDLPPRPWINVMANDAFGCLVSETGAGCAWAGNSRLHRITPWFNDPVGDPFGEALYLRDDDTGSFFSCFCGPTPAGGAYTVAHGHGYSRFHRGQDCSGLEVETLVCVPPEDPVRLTRVRITNHAPTPRRLSLFSYHQLVLGGYPGEEGSAVAVRAGCGGKGLVAGNSAAGPFAGRAAFAAVVPDHPVRRIITGTDREGFLGPALDPAHPAALERPDLNGHRGQEHDPCFALQAGLDLGPGDTADVWLLLGEEQNPDRAETLFRRLEEPGACAEAAQAAREFWHQGLGRLQVKTASPALDLMVNGWLGYQTLSCRISGRSAFYQSGGAFGFRDQLQDSLALLPLWPELVRRQILLHAAHQFPAGDVLHWWHPPHDAGIRTRFVDDLLWLPHAVLEYIRHTGEDDILEETTPYITAPRLEQGQDEVFVHPRPAGRKDTVFSHCCAALDRSLATGAHGLPLFGTGDWNDGMNRVGREGRGESVWMAFFLIPILEGFAALCRGRGMDERAETYAGHRDDLVRAANEAGWDGRWYRRGYYDDGSPLGSAENRECRIDALVQAWSVLSGAAPPERAASAMEALQEKLIDREGRLIRLLTPPFQDSAHDPGYIKGYVAGVRENGGQYTHAALWVIKALAALGRRNQAADLLDMINPVNHARNRDEVAIYQVEPYVVAADVYSAAPHVGKGGWSWYTGSSGWMLRTAVESILGFRREKDSLVLAPCIPDSWPGFSLEWEVPGGSGTRYAISVDNSGGSGEGVVSAVLDGKPIPASGGCASWPLAFDGQRHDVRATLGPMPGGRA